MYNLKDLKHIKAIIFDLDGVILKNSDLILQIFLNLLKKYSVRINEKEFINKHFKNLLGKNKEDNFNYLNKYFNIKISNKVYLREKKKLLKNNLVLKKDILLLLNFLKEKNIKVAIATSSDKFKINLLKKEFPELIRFFKIIVTKEDVLKSKPAPDLFLKAAKKLKIKPKNTIVIEDSVNGLFATIEGNFLPIIIKNPYIDISEYIPKPLFLANNHFEIYLFLKKFL